jgi:hypothetical protein
LPGNLFRKSQKQRIKVIQKRSIDLACVILTEMGLGEIIPKLLYGFAWLQSKDIPMRSISFGGV